MKARRKSGTCHKYVFATEEEARAGLAELRSRWEDRGNGKKSPPCDYYHCPTCGEYHLTSLPQERGH